MPLYEYRCNPCQTSFEVLQSMGAGPDGLVCPECGGSELSKQCSTFAATTGSATSGAGTAGRAAPGCGSGFT